MKCTHNAHVYELDNFESEGFQTLSFIEKNAVGELVREGTTNEEVLKMLIDRTQSLNKLFPCRENSIAITKMEEALMWFEKRTQDRKERGVEGTHQK